MTEKEYLDKLNMYRTSDASIEVKEKAIKKLKEDYFGVDKRNNEILQDIQDGSADIDDIVGD